MGRARRVRWGSFLSSLPEPTLAGRVTLGFLFVGLWFPLALHHNPLLFVMCALLGTVLLSVATTHLALGRLEAKRRHPARVVAGEAFDVTLEVTNRSRRPAFRVRFRDALQAAEPGSVTCGPTVAVLAPGGRVLLRYRRRLSRRGVYPVTNALAATTFPFGLFERRALIRSPGRIVVLPALGNLGSAARRELASLPRSQRARRTDPLGRDEFHSLREFRPGDNPRWIHWRTSARVDTLVRREMRSDAGRDLVVLLDTCVAGLEAERRGRAFERAVSCAATLLVDAARRGRRARIVCADGSARHAGNRRGLVGALELLAGVRPGRTPPEALADRVLSERGASALVLSLEGPAGETVRALAQRGLRGVVWDVSSPGFDRLFRRREGAP